MVLYNTEFDEGSLVTDYTVDLVDIVNTFNEIGGNVGNQTKYIFTDALEAQFTVEVQDKVEGTVRSRFRQLSACRGNNSNSRCVKD